ncbi:hypothetical protein [Mycoplasmopsis cynos]|uniref:hypothetical protein n=1 Tax=Mycoplasmopsis cynos TaxID=171284 RepID=UPI00220640FF|nr:hypothetical protein [Mycoplasmopsis cynos]UWV82693.1 hypothetical protein NW067_07265 [Mycoplasmopsis cynos]
MISFQNELETFDNIIVEIGEKIAEARKEISKLSKSKADSGILETSKTAELEKFNDLFKRLAD